MKFIEVTDHEVEVMALKHEDFGFGLADKASISTHGFGPDGLLAFARELIEMARRQVQEEA